MMPGVADFQAATRGASEFRAHIRDSSEAVMTTTVQCATCKRPMEAGFMVDHGHFNTPTPAVWAKGEPAASFWSGISLHNRMAYEVQSFRCPRCGRLEFYALRPAEN